MAHRRHEHVLAVRVVMPGRHVLDGGAFAGFRIVHIHAGHGFGCVAGDCGAAIPGRRTLRWYRARGGRAWRRANTVTTKMAPNNHGGFRGEMNATFYAADMTILLNP